MDNLSALSMVASLPGPAGSALPWKESHTDAEKEIIDRKYRSYHEVSIGSVNHRFGSGGGVRQRIAELENRKEQPQRQIRTCETDDGSRKVLNVVWLFKQFVEVSEKEFNRVSQEEWGVMIEKCIADIVIDRDCSVARFHVNSIPALNPEMERSLNFAGHEGSCVSCRSALNPARTPSGVSRRVGPSLDRTIGSVVGS
jgi:hypothetical protein